MSSPRGEDVRLGAARGFAAEYRERLDCDLSGEALVEYHRVGDDGACHSVGLGGVGHAEQGRDAGDCVGAGSAERLQYLRGALDAAFECASGGFDDALGDGYETNEVGKFLHAAREPAGFGESLAVVVMDGVRERRGADGGVKVVGVGNVFGVS